MKAGRNRNIEGAWEGSKEATGPDLRGYERWCADPAPRLRGGGCGTPWGGHLEDMELNLPCLFFDYVDPLAYLVEQALSAAGLPDVPANLRRVPLELRPPPSPLLDPDAPEWRDRWELARTAALGLGVDLAEPAFIPWSRKAHEIVLHAAGKGVGEAAHRLVFDAVFRRGWDVGRVDVLVGLARELGLDATEAKAVLDVDRHAAEVAEGRELAARLGVTASPALVSGLEILQGFHNSETLRTFLLR